MDMLLCFKEWRLLFIPWIVANGIEVLYDISMDAYLLQLGTVRERATEQNVTCASSARKTSKFV